MPATNPRKPMSPRKFDHVVLLCLVVTSASAILIAGSAAPANSRSARVLEISTHKTSEYGTVLISGTTVYTLTPSALKCGTKCLQYWPEVLLAKGQTKAAAGSGVNAAKLGTVKRSHGALQVTYAGKALYWFVGDTAIGQFNGNVTDAWGKWSVVITKPANKSASGSPTTTTTSTTTVPESTTTRPPTTTTTNPPPTTTTSAPSSGGVSF